MRGARGVDYAPAMVFPCVNRPWRVTSSALRSTLLQLLPVRHMMASPHSNSSTGAGSSSRNDTSPANSYVSLPDTRSRIVRESIATGKQKERKAPTWTKRPKFSGQATFDSHDNMSELPPSKKRLCSQLRSSGMSTAGFEPPERTETRFPGRPNASHSAAPPDDFLGQEGHGGIVDQTSFHSETFDPLVDPLMAELDNLKHAGTQYVDEPPLVDLDDWSTPIPHEILVAEVKAIYAGLVVMEQRCVAIQQQCVHRERALPTSTSDSGPSRQANLSPEQYSAIIALHRTLLHEHHDFILATQHPAASPALRSLADKYRMPERMWRYGIEAFLEVLHHRDLDSIAHSFSFVSYAESTLSLLDEHIPWLHHQWTAIQEALQEYGKVLSNLNQGLRRSYPKFTLPWDLSSQNFGVLNRDSYEPIEPPDSRSTQLQIEADCPHLPKYVTNSLIGWLLFGQSIAHRSFETYLNVFSLLSLTAEFSNSLFASALGKRFPVI